MTGAYFFHAIKTDRLLREHFGAWIKEQRAEHARELEGANFDNLMYRAQGKIHALDTLMSLLEQALNLSPADPFIADATSTSWEHPKQP